MYRHLLVPIDSSTLATELVRQAVLLAKSLGASVTFFHAQEDYGATSLAALERAMWPTLGNEQTAGDARAVLAKAAVVAREAGVAHDTVTVTSGRPYEAILSAAEARGCDLIVIASHGRRGLRGLMLGSQTRNVLQQSSLPVLVLAVESNVAEWEKIQALAIIRDEHRSLAAVAHGLELLARQARDDGKPPRFDLLRAIVHYVREFPESLHHPKEDAWLFRKLRERTTAFNDTLAELEGEHVEGRSLVDELEHSIAAYEADPGGGHARFAAAVTAFVVAQERHMRLETRVILPAAFEYLTVEDWNEIGRAFAENGDPRFNADGDEEFRQLFARILNLMPAPRGGRQDAGLSSTRP
jgi:nucleotide-binding universal stress UspA family protein/hemerythrin-like domain-containing protein